MSLVESVMLDVVKVEHTLVVVGYRQGGWEETAVIEVELPEPAHGVVVPTDAEELVGRTGWPWARVQVAETAEGRRKGS